MSRQLSQVQSDVMDRKVLSEQLARCGPTKGAQQGRQGLRARPPAPHTRAHGRAGLLAVGAGLLAGRAIAQPAGCRAGTVMVMPLHPPRARRAQANLSTKTKELAVARQEYDARM